MAEHPEQNSNTLEQQRSQLRFPLDAESESTLRLGMEKLIKDVIVRHNRVQLTLVSGTTSFAVASNYMIMTGAASVTIATIAGGREGMILTLEFVDANVKITDTGTGAVDTVNLSGSSIDFTGAANGVIQLQHNGISWREVARSGNFFADPLTTKGDIINFASATQRFGIGTNDQVLTADSGESAGMKWATPSVPILKIGRVQTATNLTADLTTPHGLGVTPKLIEITAMCNTGTNTAAMSFGRGIATSDEFCIFTYQPFPNGGTIGRSTSSIILLRDTSDNVQFECNLKTLDSTNFVLEVTTNVVGGSTRNWHWTAFA